MKKLLLLICCLATFPGLSAATVEYVYNYLKYTVDTKAKTAACTGPQNKAIEIVDLVIPDYIEYQEEQYPVVSVTGFYDNNKISGTLTLGKNIETIGYDAFAFSDRLTGDLTIPNSVIKIGQYAFTACSGLNGTLVIGDKTTVIGAYSFNGCKFTNLVLGESLEEIQYSAFAMVPISGQINFPKSLKYIGSGAFYGCDITSIFIPDSSERLYIGRDSSNSVDTGEAFANCNNLTTIYCFAKTTPLLRVSSIDPKPNFSNKWKINVYVPLEYITPYQNSKTTTNVSSPYEGWSEFNLIAVTDLTAKSVTLDRNSLSMKLGDEETLIATVEPFYTTDVVEWSVSPDGIVSVSDGKVVALKGGNATITATCGTASATCDVSVIVDPTGISLNKKSLSMEVGDVETLIATLEPEGATGDVEWSVLPDGFVSVDNGKVTAFAKGQAVVTASCGNHTATCVVTVAENAGNTDTPSTPGYSDDQITAVVFMEPNEQRSFADLASGLSASSWESSDERMAEVYDIPLFQLNIMVVTMDDFGQFYVIGKDADGKEVAVFKVYICPTVTVEHPEGSVYVHHVLYKSQPKLNLTPAAGFDIAGVTYSSGLTRQVTDITDLVVANDGYYTPSEPVTANAVINIALKANSNGPLSGTAGVAASGVRLLVDGHDVTVEGAGDQEVLFYNLQGHPIFPSDTSGNTYTLRQSGVYIVCIGEDSYKVIIR